MRWIRDRTAFSGMVSRLLTCDIIQLRCWGDTVSKSILSHPCKLVKIHIHIVIQVPPFRACIDFGGVYSSPQYLLLPRNLLFQHEV